MSNRTITILISVFFSLLSSPAASQDSLDKIASVIAIRGVVQAIDPDGIYRDLRINDQLYISDTIDTGDRGRIQVLFTDNTIISLGKKSILIISDYKFSNDKKSGQIKTSVSEGVFRVMGGILSKSSPQKFITETPSGSIGIRGSMYAGHVSGNNLELVFEGGKGITFSNTTGLVNISEPGLGTNTTGINDPIKVPYTFSRDNLKFIHQELSDSKSFNQAQNQYTKRIQLKPHFKANELKITSLSQTDSQSHTPSKSGNIQLDLNKEDNKDSSEKKKSNFESDFISISTETRENQENAASIFKNAVMEKGMAVDSALVSVLMGMTNSNREAFDSVINEAIEMGVTVEQTKQIADMLRNNGVCK